MSEETNETASNGNKIWLTKANAIIFAILFTLLGVNLGFLFLASSGIGLGNSRVESAHSRIDSTNSRIIDVQNLYFGLNSELRKANRNVAKQGELLEQLVLNFEEVFDRLAKLESAQEADSQ